jgi:transposase
VRVTTAFNRMLRLPGASVIDVSFGAEGVIVTVRLRRRRRVCSGCGQLGGQIHGRRLKRWRHLDLGANRCLIECELRRLWCRDCGARYEAVPWARAGSRYTRDFEDVVAWLAQQMAKTPIAGLLRIAWDSVGRIVERVIADRLDERRLSGLVAIGVDEISYRRHHRYLSSITAQARSCGARRAAIPPPCSASSTSSASAATQSARSRSTCRAATKRRSATRRAAGYRAPQGAGRLSSHADNPTAAPTESRASARVGASPPWAMALRRVNSARTAAN